MNPLPELDLARIRRFVARRNEGIPPAARSKIRIELDVDDRSATIVECRPPWRPGMGPAWTRSPVARLRYAKARREWALYWRDRNQRFHLYDPVGPTPVVAKLLDEVERDRTGIFWG